MQNPGHAPELRTWIGLEWHSEVELIMVQHEKVRVGSSFLGLGGARLLCQASPLQSHEAIFSERTKRKAYRKALT